MPNRLKDRLVEQQAHKPRNGHAFFRGAAELPSEKAGCGDKQTKQPSSHARRQHQQHVREEVKGAVVGFRRDFRRRVDDFGRARRGMACTSRGSWSWAHSWAWSWGPVHVDFGNRDSLSSSRVERHAFRRSHPCTLPHRHLHVPVGVGVAVVVQRRSGGEGVDGHALLGALVHLLQRRHNPVMPSLLLLVPDSRNEARFRGEVRCAWTQPRRP
mmetsp:Transcript_66070/g.144278  ORF Transcript_66070/g.144278 Transcript_66070/m.144278 type:complete len:213 (-) Transcript_66070:1600-2238(-)